jgi:hypothetical protein
MKKNILIFILIPLISLSQSNRSLETIDLGIIETPGGWDDVIPQFKPIGWSKDGKFAYRNTMCDDMCGCCTDGIAVISAITDETVEYLPCGEGGGDFREMSMKDSIMEVRKTLSRNSIVVGSVGQFIKSNQINDYNIILNQKRISAREGANIGFDLEYKLIVGNNNIGYKTVSGGIITDLDQDLQYLGYIKSPFEDRILILFSDCSLGLEMTYRYDLYLVGCNLNPKTF